jgi:hypothetical protein
MVNNFNKLTVAAAFTGFINKKDLTGAAGASINVVDDLTNAQNIATLAINPITQMYSVAILQPQQVGKTIGIARAFTTASFFNTEALPNTTTAGLGGSVTSGTTKYNTWVLRASGFDPDYLELTLA